MADTPLWITAAPERGYDHPIDRMQISTVVTPAFTPREIPVMNETQVRDTAERLLLDRHDVATVIGAMATAALGAQSDRDAWEDANLRAMNIGLRIDREKTLVPYNDEYARAVGRPAMIASFVDWFSRCTVDLPAQPAGMVILGQDGRIRAGELTGDMTQDRAGSGLDTIEQAVKGYTLTIGTANQMGTYKLSDRLNDSVDEALKTLARSGYSYGVRHYRYNRAPRKHRVGLVEIDGQPLEADDGNWIVHMVRERGVADVLSETSEVHVVKRFDAFVAIRSIALIRDLLHLLATSGGRMIGDKESAGEVTEFVKLYEKTIHRHGEANDLFATAPLATSYLIRNPKK